MRYDVVCPICGVINRGLYLEDSDGNMECIRCRNITRYPAFQKIKRMPVFSMEHKIGGQEFNDVVLAAYTLCEVYGQGPEVVTSNGEIVNVYPIIGWLNHLLGTEFTMEKRFRMWDVAECYACERLDYNDPISAAEVRDILPGPLLRYAGGTDLADLFLILDGTKDLEPGVVARKPLSYTADIVACRQVLARYFSESEEKTSLNRLWNLLKLDRKQRVCVTDPLLSDVARETLFLPARVIVFLATEIKKKEFWETWKKLKEKVYHDEILKEYASSELKDFRAAGKAMPVPGMKSSDYLIQNSYFTFYGTPKELQDKPKYYVSDDDRLYWWDGSDEVVISEEGEAWLQKLALEYKELLNLETEEEKGADQFFQDFILLLVELDDTFKRIFPFQSMFYDFLQNGHKKEYRAAVGLIRKAAEENRKEGEAIRFLTGSWELTSRRVTFNPGRVRMKQLMSVLANRKLREKYFGF
ncbi:MAG: hypothetical protein IJ773_12145 [Lachnospiraceae bacterium]|nr:hypothetical protein [Lachnospiraceae bacterium]